MKSGMNVRYFTLFILILVCAGCASSTKQWQKARITNTIDAYERFISAHPDSERVPEAKDNILDLAWKKATRTDTVQSYEDFLARYAQYANTSMTEHAKEKIKVLKKDEAWKQALDLNTIASYKAFLDAYPDSGPISEEAKTRLRKLGFTRLMKSAVSGDVAMVKQVLDGGSIDVNAKDSEGFTALHKACLAGKVESVALLLQRGANPNAYVYTNQKTGNHKVTCDRRTGVVKQVLDVGATPLLFACEKGSAPIVEMLIKYNADVNLAGKDGLEFATPLCTAILYGHTDIVKILLRHRADVNQKGAKALFENVRMGKINLVMIPPLSLSERLGKKDIRQILIRAGAKSQ